MATDKNIDKKNLSDAFESIRISLASPEKILEWSHGEITKPETINYRTLKPEKDGLFDERIFGPTKDWECYCGKYKKIRYKGIVCDKCGVEVTRALVRRERMGHIGLAVPVTHIWYLRGAPSKLALALDVPSRKLEQVVYFAAYIVTEVNEEMRQQAINQLASEYAQHTKGLKNDYKKKMDVASNLTERERISKELAEKLDKLKLAYNTAVSEIGSIKLKTIISELEYRDLSLKYGGVFKAGIGAEAVYDLVNKLEVTVDMAELKKELVDAVGQRRKRLQKRLRLLTNFHGANILPSWMLLANLPVIPPDLRPMVQLDGGRFATSDLNDLYRRVINRNNRLKKLLDLGAPEVITRNEKRMLQEAVDALLDLTARETSTSTVSKRKLKSLSDLLRGKQGRFRQNLLGKRVDYSGRSVIVVGPTLNLGQCGLPKTIALEIFKPFVIANLMRNEIVHNVKTASKMVERQVPEVWDALDEVIGCYYVLLNRAPTLHRLGIQAFKPVLVEGNAIQLHPLTCSAFNADFDGDQMAVHLPLSRLAQIEARDIMLSTHNLLKPATGDPIIVPSQDVVLGCYYATLAKPLSDNQLIKSFKDIDELVLAHVNGFISYHDVIKIKITPKSDSLETTLGRVLFNQIIPEGIAYINAPVVRKTLKNTIRAVYEIYGDEITAKFADDLKNIGFKFATASGATFSASDIIIPTEKPKIMQVAEDKVEQIRLQYREGLITAEEKKRLSIEVWADTKSDIENLAHKKDDPFLSINLMMDSQARGSMEQLNQMAGMKGIVVNPAGNAIELPVKSNYKEGLTPLEYFISTHGARKGGADTALKTSDAGYLTRRLVDVAQDMTITEADCGAQSGRIITKEYVESINDNLYSVVTGRFTLEPIISADGKEIVPADTYIDKIIAKTIEESGATEVTIRSILNCQSEQGACQKCYGEDLARGKVVELGEAVGIIAAQSIGEPGTQLTMRTFHTGGVASALDITQGLPRVEELFEARNPKTEALLAEKSGTVTLTEINNKKFLQLLVDVDKHMELPSGKKVTLKVKDGAKVKKGDVIAIDGIDEEIKSMVSGIVNLSTKKGYIVYQKKEMLEYPITSSMYLKVIDGQEIEQGDRLTEGHYNLKTLMRLQGEDAAKQYILSEIQKIYAWQGQNINDKHVEVIVKRMFGLVRIEDEGDSDYIAGDVVSRLVLDRIIAKLQADGKRLPQYESLLLGISKAALNTDGFLSAASFQETTRVLVDAATQGKVDYLKGLKENVIIGRLIPAGTGFVPKVKPIEPVTEG
ncbi:DNA-directed RNA polymerase subunit beta' [Patescibacteria group bacterium]|nr:DNA-directed RNA polymerase subunit beta' [Patescibacteria group bacterium]